MAVAAAIDLHDPLAVQSDFSVLPDPLSVRSYDYTDIRQGVHDRHYQVHIKRRGLEVTELPPQKRYPARRWVVERTLSWQNDFRSLRTRWAKKAKNWLTLIQFASALVLWRMANGT